jgi:hypothetical protein
MYACGSMHKTVSWGPFTLVDAEFSHMALEPHGSVSLCKRHEFVLNAVIKHVWHKTRVDHVLMLDRIYSVDGAVTLLR